MAGLRSTTCRPHTADSVMALHARTGAHRSGDNPTSRHVVVVLVMANAARQPLNSYLCAAPRREGGAERASRLSASAAARPRSSRAVADCRRGRRPRAVMLPVPVALGARTVAPPWPARHGRGAHCCRCCCCCCCCGGGGGGFPAHSWREKRRLPTVRQALDRLPRADKPLSAGI